MKTNPEKDTELHDKINRETARVGWDELERHFAQGNVIYVSETLDLIDVAVRISHDDKESITRWMSEGKIAKVSAMCRPRAGPPARSGCGPRSSIPSSWCSPTRSKSTKPFPACGNCNIEKF